MAPAIIAWETWKRSGDAAGLRNSFNAAKAVVDFLSDHRDPSTGLVTYGYYGDWLAIEGEEAIWAVGDPCAAIVR